MTYPADSGATAPPPEQFAPPSVPWEAPPDEAAGPAPGVRFASHGLRLVAYIVDGLILGLAYVVVFLVLSFVLVGAAGAGNFATPSRGEINAGAAALFGLIILITIVLALAYFPFFWARSGQTPGMRLFGLYVVRDRDGGKISAGQAILRLIGLWVSAIPIYLGFIWIFIDARRRGWHDLIAGTVMIERRR
jgi:uncharacterized RDD family membrane protein YckC